MVTITHEFVSAKSDGGDATLVQPTDWNADHIIEGTDWTSYTPALTATTTNPTLGSSTLTGRYRLLGPKTCQVGIRLVWNTGGGASAGSGEWKFSLPFAADTSIVQLLSLVGIDNGLGYFIGHALLIQSLGADVAHPLLYGQAPNVASGIGAAEWRHNLPIVTYANSDELRVYGIYQTT